MVAGNDLVYRYIYLKKKASTVVVVAAAPSPLAADVVSLHPLAAAAVSPSSIAADAASPLAGAPPAVGDVQPPSGGTRCSLRYVGKKRPFYGEPKPEAAPLPPPKKKTGKKGGRSDKAAVKSGGGDLSPVSRQASVVLDPPSGGSVENGQALANVNRGQDVSSESAEGKGPSLKVKETLRAFNAHYLHFVQEEERRYKEVEALIKPKALETKLKSKKTKKLANVVSKSEDSKVVVGGEGTKRASKRPDLKAITKMHDTKTILYPEKRIGHLPGIEVGHQFFSRAEMVVLGLHSHWLNGIDYMGVSYGKLEQNKNYKFPLAVCIVLSGMYEDDLDNSDDVVYTGQGGHDLLGNKQQIADQKLLRGNLALKNCMECQVPVRVVRGHVSHNSYCGKVYTYDGLYQVIKFWVEKGVSGFTVFKYRLVRCDGQPPLTTNQVLFTKARAPVSAKDLRGLVCEDISGGQENFPIPATNVVDDPPFAPTDFVYTKSLQISKSIELPENCMGCQCKGDCVNSRTCACARLNGSDFPYVKQHGGRLIEAKAVVFECGPNCGCNQSCVNRTSQKGLMFHLEVFRTPTKGWAVRSWDSIPSGSPICEYTGILKKTDETEKLNDNSYLFDIDCLQTMKGLDGRTVRPGDVSVLDNFDDTMADGPEYCIDAGHYGNIARFINHSCQPNLFVQCVLSSHRDIKIAKVMLFAADNIPPLQELTYDYGYILDSVVGSDGNVKKLPCYCGAPDCRKRLY